MPQNKQVISLDEAVRLPHDHKHPPANITGECLKCGKCCVYYQCPLVDPETGCCRIYENRPVGCRVWPQGMQELIDTLCTGYSQTGL